MRQKSWPKDAAWVVRRLNTIVPNLEEAGIRYERLETQRPKLIRLSKILQSTDATDEPTDDIDKEQSKGTEDDAGNNDGKTGRVTSTDSSNGLLQHSASVETVPSVISPKQFSIDDMEKIKSREECSEMTDVEYDIYLEKSGIPQKKSLKSLLNKRLTVPLPISSLL